MSEGMDEMVAGWSFDHDEKRMTYDGPLMTPSEAVISFGRALRREFPDTEVPE